MVEEHHPAIGRFRVLRIEPVKHSTDREEWKRFGIVLVNHVVERGVRMTVGQHRLDNLNGVKRRKSSRPFTLGGRDPSQQFRRYRCHNSARFVEQILAYWARELLDSIQAFEQRLPRPRARTRRR